ncbi:c-type cytochrome [Parabacteroides sp. PF5-6]|uniref:c-type cytochrome n=1 Tax=Parabacteroides sp. PF5-6 TaxID=1742403 RepID=UPI0024067E10|nr:c-type cytochrome [Parabacteroides sp. PF5-6]
MNKIGILYITMFCLFLTGCDLSTGTFAPDRVFQPDASGRIWVNNRSENTLMLFQPDLKNIEKKVTFEQPVNDIEVTADRLWVVCDGSNGSLYELNANDLSILSETEMGACPSAVVYNPASQSLWVTQRFHNALWEVDPQSKQVLTRLEIGREPVDLVTFNQGKHLLVVNNLPEMASTDFPVTALLTVVDTEAKTVVKRIYLPNGSTDVKAVALSADQKYAYVTHLIARYQLPTNQVDRGWMSTNALSIIDLDTQDRLTTVLLDTPQKGAANPWGVVVTPDDKQILAVASGTHEIVCIDREGMHERIQKVMRGEKTVPSTHRPEDIPNDAGFLYGLVSFIGTDGKGPREIVIGGNKAYTANYYTGELIALDWKTQEKTRVPSSANSLTATIEGRGEMYFYDASLCFQGWQSCISCHPNDARMDGLNWDQKNDGLGNPKNTKSLLLSHETPPSMVTGIRKNAETAVRAGYKHILFAADNEEITHAMDVWLRSLRPLPSPYLVNGELSETAKRGKEVFAKNCADCHSGPNYTDMKQYYVSWATEGEKEVKMDVPTLIEVWRTAPYLYDGRVYSMREMLDIHGATTDLSTKELDDLTEYVLSL